MSELSKQERAATVASLGLTVESAFVPLSQSRNKTEKYPTLNWKVTVKRNGRDVLTTDYSAGSAHCPAYNASVKAMGERNSLMRDAAIRFECEHGKAAAAYDSTNSSAGYVVRELVLRGKALEPDALDVLASLAMDSDVIDAGGFEEWAGNFGYDVDSRRAEATYRACLETALKLRAALGDDGLAALRNAFKGY